jgi:hypothetical protein
MPETPCIEATFSSREAKDPATPSARQSVGRSLHDVRDHAQGIRWNHDGCSAPRSR